METYNKLQNVALLMLRLIVAAIFILAGIAKWPFWNTPIEGMSETMANLVKFLSIVEPLGALALILGFLTRWAAAGLGIIMIGAIIILSATMGATFFTQPQALGWDYNLLIFGGCLIFVAFGGGRWAIDNIIATRKFFR